MGDDFDLFPKRENLDPFSFGKKDGTEVKEKGPDAEEEVFGQETPPTLPDESTPALGSEPEVDLPSSVQLDPFELPVASSERDVGDPDPVSTVPEGSEVYLPIETTDEATPPSLPISEEKTFDEPDISEAGPEVEKGSTGKERKSSSPFVLIGGALVLIMGILYLVNTYLLEKEPPPKTLPPLKPALMIKTPATQPEVPVASETPAVQSVAGEPAQEKVPEPASSPAPIPVPAAPKAVTVAVESKPAAAPPETPALVMSSKAGFSVQTGALILDSSVRELEKKLKGLGYEPFFKKGSTMAMLNNLTVGPFGTVNEAETALARLQKAGIDSNLRRTAGGGAVINAGSYLLAENAKLNSRKIRSFGYPVKIVRKETQFPMTIVRVGNFETVEDAAVMREELKSKGFDALVVKLQ